MSTILRIVSLVFFGLLSTQSSLASQETARSQSIDSADNAKGSNEAEQKTPYLKAYEGYRIKPHETALILLHGKWGKPPAPQASAFSAEGFKVISPEMPWAGVRRYDQTYEDALKEINLLTKRLRADGYKFVIVGGQSFGANGALAYASAYGDVDGILLFAPGHNPDIDRNYQPRIVGIAKEAITSGKPDALISFTDYNDGGRTRTIETRSDVFVSFFAEDGPANMALNAAKMRAVIPPIVFMGSNDFGTRQGSSYFFDRLPKHNKSKYIVSTASHREVPAASFETALSWIKDLIRQ